MNIDENPSDADNEFENVESVEEFMESVNTTSENYSLKVIFQLLIQMSPQIVIILYSFIGLLDATSYEHKNVI